MYPGVRPDFDAAAVDLWKNVQKQALTAREGDVGIDVMEVNFSFMLRL